MPRIAPGSTLSTAACASAVAMLLASVARATPPTPSDPSEPNGAVTEQPAPAEQTMLEPSAAAPAPSSRFTMYRPNYFITGSRDFGAGGRHPDVKFQISVRYELLTGPPKHVHLMLAYTQKSFWNIYDSSAPFRENNYNPELYLQWHPEDAPASYLKLGFAHESNGLGSASSRSWDRGFAEARVGLGALTLYPMIWWPVRLSDNPRILRSFGWGELIARLRLGENVELEAVGRLGSLFDRGSLLLGLNIGSVLQIFGVTEQKWFTPHVYLQLWHGYGESLVDYEVKSTAARAGFMLRR